MLSVLFLSVNALQGPPTSNLLFESANTPLIESFSHYCHWRHVQGVLVSGGFGTTVSFYMPNEKRDELLKSFQADLATDLQQLTKIGGGDQPVSKLKLGPMESQNFTDICAQVDSQSLVGKALGVCLHAYTFSNSDRISGITYQYFPVITSAFKRSEIVRVSIDYWRSGKNANLTFFGSSVK